MNNSDLLLLKSELTNDPLNLGLTVLPEDDEANANLLNEVRDSIQVFRASVPANDIQISPDEQGGLNATQSEWLLRETIDGNVNPAVFQAGFYSLFGPGTAARASFDSLSKESASRARQLFGKYVNITPSDVANARNAT
jgi:hypothetical protein